MKPFLGKHMTPRRDGHDPARTLPQLPTSENKRVRLLLALHHGLAPLRNPSLGLKLCEELMILRRRCTSSAVHCHVQAGRNCSRRPRNAARRKQCLVLPASTAVPGRARSWGHPRRTAARRRCRCLDSLRANDLPTSQLHHATRLGLPHTKPQPSSNRWGNFRAR